MRTARIRRMVKICDHTNRFALRYSVEGPSVTPWLLRHAPSTLLCTASSAPFSACARPSHGLCRLRARARFDGCRRKEDHCGVAVCRPLLDSQWVALLTYMGRTCSVKRLWVATKAVSLMPLDRGLRFTFYFRGCYAPHGPQSFPLDTVRALRRYLRALECRYGHRGSFSAPRTSGTEFWRWRETQRQARARGWVRWARTLCSGREVTWESPGEIPFGEDWQRS